jgi:mannose-1-phosphate guanylyltransferase
MRAVVLVGGEGTRLRPLTYTTPKQMLPIAEVPMIVRVLEGLGRHGVDSAVLSLGYRPDAFIDAFPDSIAGGVKLEYVVEETLLDTAGAVRFAATESGIADTFIVVNGDVLTDLDLSELIALHRERRAECTIALTPVADPSRFGIVVTEDDGRVREFVEKPLPGEEPGNLANAGTYVVEPSVIGRIPAGRRVSIERETFPLLASEGTLYAFSSEAYWLDTGTPAHYLAAQLDIVAGKRPGVGLPGVEELDTCVHVAPDAKVAGKLAAPCLIGRRAVVGEGSSISCSIVSSGAVIESDAVVIGSVVLPGARICARARVEDSVIGEGASIGEDAVVRWGSVVGPGAEVPPGSELVEARFPAEGPA